MLPRVRRLLTPVLALALSLSVGCPGPNKGTSSSPANMPAWVKTYGALRWVPANASYAVVARQGLDLSNTLRDLADTAGLAFDADAQVAGEWSLAQFGYDLFSPDSLAGIGIDVHGGAAIFGTGLSPTVVAKLEDPGKLEAFVDRMRSNGVSMQSQMSDGAEVFSIRMDDDLTVSWTVIDGWILSRVELGFERAPELGWLAGARGAAGAMGGDADFNAAVEVSKSFVPALAADAPPVVTVIRPGRLADVAEQLMDTDEIDVAACLSPLRSIPRIVGVSSSTDAGITGAMVADLADAAPLAALMLAPPGGWATARDGAVLQVDLGVDVESALQVMGACIPRGESRGTFGVKTAHLAVHAFDDDGFPSMAAAYADLSSDRALRGLMSQIPFLGRMSSSRKIGTTDVVDVSIPFMMDFTYLLTPTRAAASRGNGMMEKVLGAGNAPTDELAAFRIVPAKIPDRTWHLALEQGLDVGRDSARERTIQRARAWEVGSINARLVDRRVVVTLSATRRK